MLTRAAEVAKQLREIAFSISTMLLLGILIVVGLVLAKHRLSERLVTLAARGADQATTSRSEEATQILLAEASRIQAAISAHRRRVRSSNGPTIIAADQQLEFQIPGSEVSVESILRPLAILLGQAPIPLAVQIESRANAGDVLVLTGAGRPIESPCAGSDCADAARRAAGLLLAEYDPCAFVIAPIVQWSPDAPGDSSAGARRARSEVAAARCLALAETASDRHEALLLWARLLEHHGDLPGALRKVEEAERMGGTSSDAHLEWARLRPFIDSDPTGEAEAIERLRSAEALSRLDPSRAALARMQRGLMAYSKERFAEAATIHAEALGMLQSPLEADQQTESLIQYNFGNALRDNFACHGDPANLDAAAKAYRTAILVAPRSAYAHNGLGRYYAIVAEDASDSATARRAWNDAVAAYWIAAALDPSFAEPNNNLGIAYRELGDLDIAAHHHRLALEDDPRSAYTRIDYAKTLIARNDLAAAENEIAAADTVMPNNPYVDEARGLLAERRGDVTATKRWYERALRHLPQDCERSPKRHALKVRIEALQSRR